ncbi:hypothetical protein ACLOJK_008727 [Asimina triloba]
MEEEKIIESLDSNWFFCSVFKPPPSSSRHSCKGPPTPPQDTLPRKEPIPTMQVPLKELNQSTSAGLGTEIIPGADISVHDEKSSEMEPGRARCKRSGESSLKGEVIGFAESGFDVGRYDVPVSEEKSSGMEQRRSKESSNSCLARKGRSCWMQEFENVRGFVELGSTAEDIGLGSGLPVGRFDIPRGIYLHCKMPPSGNGIAMKEHLKSWAYAVACTVR